MKMALVGPPGSGKTTLFSAVTGKPIDLAVLAQEQTAAIKVPDARLDDLTRLYRPKKTTHAMIEVSDFPGIHTRDESARQHYKKHLPQIRLCDVLVAVVNDLAGQAQAELSALYDDFIFADLEAVANRTEKLDKSLKKPTKTHEQEKRELALMHRCAEALEQLKPLSTVLQHQEEAQMVRSFAFLTEKPLVVVVNVSEDKAATPPLLRHEHAYGVLAVCAQAEADIIQLEPGERPAFLSDLGITEPARDRLIQTAYQAAGLISFLTTGPDEVRAWPVRKGAGAVEAAGKIHSDIAKGFIRAETMAYDDLAAAQGDEKAVKAAGKLRQEGKEYIVKDGDIIHFKFNV